MERQRLLRCSRMSKRRVSKVVDASQERKRGCCSSFAVNITRHRRLWPRVACNNRFLLPPAIQSSVARLRFLLSRVPNLVREEPAGIEGRGSRRPAAPWRSPAAPSGPCAASTSAQSGRRRTPCAAPCTSCRRAVPAAELREGAAVGDGHLGPAPRSLSICRRVPDRSLVSWNTVVDVLAGSGHHLAALDQFSGRCSATGPTSRLTPTPRRAEHARRRAG